MMIEPHTVDWRSCSDEDVHWAAEGGIPQAVNERARREGMYRTAPAVMAKAASIAKAKAARDGMR